MPKTNMYQSLHTTIFGAEGKLFEIQIRTHEMHKIAEYGIASHWTYKAKGGSVKTVKDSMEQKLQIFRNIMEINEVSDTPEEFINSIKQEVLTTDSIYVYTPKGDVIELPKNSTPIDFAYKVHTEVGNTVVGAIVNDAIVPLDYNLKTGDIIKINTSKSAKPNKDWLSFVITSQARSKIKAYYNKLEKDVNLEKGQELLESELRHQSLPIEETLSNKNLEKIFRELNLKNINELYLGIASNKYTAQSVLRIIRKEEEEPKPKIGNLKVPTSNKNDILVEGMNDIKVNLSGCCKPIPGDKIIGYITKGSGITIHRITCSNISDLSERLVKVRWNSNITKKYFTDIIVHTNTSDNLLDIVTKANANGIGIDSISTINKSQSKIYSITVLVENLDKLNKFITELNNLPFTIEVERIK